MAPKPSYQLLIWSVPAVALLLTCLWYRRKKNSLRSDPGGTSSVDSAVLLSKKPHPSLEPASELSKSQLGSAQKARVVENGACSAAADLEHEVSSTEELCGKTETDCSFAAVQREDSLHVQGNCNNVLGRTAVQDTSLVSLQKVSHLNSEPLLKKNKEEFEKLNENNISKSQEGSGKKGTGEVISDCSAKHFREAECKAEAEEKQYKGKTKQNCELEESEQVTSTYNVQVLSEKVTGDKSDKSVDILNFQQVQESYSAGKPSRGTVFTADSLSEQLPEENCGVSSSEECVSTSSVDSESTEEGSSESTVLQSPPCEGCSISDSASTKKHFEDSDETPPSRSVANTSDPESEAGRSDSAAAATRTVMARKSSTDLAMEKNADSDGASGYRDGKLPESEQSKDCADNVPVERDSANHSPADVMLGSPAISNYSDANSEGSSDSGKGCSDMATPPPRTPASGSSLAGDVPSIYEFVLPQHLVGRLIGRYGAFVHQIKDKTNANILIKRHPDTTKLKICAIEGNQMGIERALEMIRDKFPVKKYPNVTLEQVCFVPAAPVFPVPPQCLQLSLVEGVNNDVIVSYLVNPAHVFLQQPTHPTFLNLNTQAAYMQACYNEPTVPALPRPVTADVICVAPVMNDWCRAQVVSDEAEDGTCTIKLLDYGGYDNIDCSLLRQIRQDFMLLPFQAAEAYLANIRPAGGADEEWSREALDVLQELTKSQVVEAQVVAYAENTLPIVYLYSIVRSKAIFVNYELVKRGLAEWTDSCAVLNGDVLATDGVMAEECDRVVAAEQ